MKGLYVAEPFRLLRHERHEDDTAPASHSGREQMRSHPTMSCNAGKRIIEVGFVV